MLLLNCVCFASAWSSRHQLKILAFRPLVWTNSRATTGSEFGILILMLLEEQVLSTWTYVYVHSLPLHTHHSLTPFQVYSAGFSACSGFIPFVKVLPFLQPSKCQCKDRSFMFYLRTISFHFRLGNFWISAAKPEFWAGENFNQIYVKLHAVLKSLWKMDISQTIFMLQVLMFSYTMFMIDYETIFCCIIIVLNIGPVLLSSHVFKNLDNVCKNI